MNVNKLGGMLEPYVRVVCIRENIGSLVYHQYIKRLFDI